MDNQLYVADSLASDWTLIKNSGLMKNIYVSSDNKIYGTGSDNQIYIRESLNSPWSSPMPNSCCVISASEYT